MRELVLADSAQVLDAGGLAALMSFIDKLRQAHNPRIDISHGATPRCRYWYLLARMVLNRDNIGIGRKNEDMYL